MQKIQKEDVYTLLFNMNLNKHPDLESIKNKLTNEEWKHLDKIMRELAERYATMFSSNLDSLEYQNAKKLNWWRCLTVGISTFMSTTLVTLAIWIVTTFFL